MKRLSITLILLLFWGAAYAQNGESFTDKAFSVEGMIFGAIGALVGVWWGMRGRSNELKK